MGNAITPMPGAVVLAAPFVLLGNSAYQNGFWLAVFFVALAHRLKDARAPLLLLWTVLLLSPVVLHALLTGNDYVANSLYILLPLACLSDAVSGRARPSRRAYSALVFLGVGLSSRANFLILLPLVTAFLAHRVGARTAILYTGVVIAVFAGVTLPFYLHDPPHFSPLHTTHKLAQYESILPHAGLVVPTLGALAAVALSGTRLNRTLPQLLRNCAVVQAALVVPVGVMATIRSQRLDLTEAGYGIFFLFFGVTAYWLARSGALRRAARANPDGSGEA
ncbi:MAG: hypothetical protein M5R40_14365 [Anaerolineae bacterium]|nr:hypothetical protein [Anaerolineae bacterium]